MTDGLPTLFRFRCESNHRDKKRGFWEASDTHQLTSQGMPFSHGTIFHQPHVTCSHPVHVRPLGSGWSGDLVPPQRRSHRRAQRHARQPATLLCLTGTQKYTFLVYPSCQGRYVLLICLFEARSGVSRMCGTAGGGVFVSGIRFHRINN